MTTYLWDTTLADNCSDSDFAALCPYIEQMGSGQSAAGPSGYKKEFWWEREWRHVGDFALPSQIICLCPEKEIDYFSGVMSELGQRGKCIDPQWSLERIIAHLVGFPKDETEI